MSPIGGILMSEQYPIHHFYQLRKICMTHVSQPTGWDKKFLDQAKLNASWSKDPSTGVGSVIVRPNNKAASQGFNGFPSKIPDDPEWLNDRAIKYKVTIHAELNAILSANEDLDGYTIYVYPFMPCESCALSIIQKGITRVVSIKPPEDKLVRWKESFDFAQELFDKAGVEVVIYDTL